MNSIRGKIYRYKIMSSIIDEKKELVIPSNVKSEKIGNNIDLAMIDTAHFEPGEILDFLLILPWINKRICSSVARG